MNRTKYRLKTFVTLLFILISLGLNPRCVWASDKPNTITFYNLSGEYSLVKLMGPTGQTIEVPHGERRTVKVAAGEYYILVRYGGKPDQYKYSKGDLFTVTQTATEYSVITITLHKVVDGNYPVHPVSSEEFDNAAGVRQRVDGPEGITTLTPVFPPPKIGFPPPTIHLPPPTINLPPPAVQFPPPTIQFPAPTINLPPPTIQLPPPTIHLPPPTIQIPSPTEIDEKKEGTVK